MSNYLKPQSPIYNESTDSYIYPLTTSDQVIMPDGSRLEDNVVKQKAGFIYPLASANVPEGFLLCDGAEYLREEYPELFTAIGTIYGSGDGVSTFNIPNLQTRVPIGMGDGYELGNVGGEETHTLTINEIPAHTHKLTVVNPEGNIGSKSTDQIQYGYDYNNNTYYTNDNAMTSTGGSKSHNNMQPYTVVNYIIATGKNTGVNVQDIITGIQVLPLGVEYGGTGATNIEDARNNLGAMSMDLLWENASPDSDFLSQEILLNLNEYRQVLIRFKQSTTANIDWWVWVTVGTTAYTVATANVAAESTNVTHVQRISNVKNDRVLFYDISAKRANESAPLNSSSYGNNWLIPYQIYGVKGVN